MKKPREASNNGTPPLEIDDKHLPWVTVRDAFVNLAAPAACESKSRLNHWVIPGARVYSGHSGSILDWPSKTLKAGVHGVPGGENVVVDDNGKVRYYTLRETARLQTFPDTHFFEGARLHVTRQVGNAVPCKLAFALCQSLYQLISAALPSLETKRTIRNERSTVAAR